MDLLILIFQCHGRVWAVSNERNVLFISNLHLDLYQNSTFKYNVLRQVLLALWQIYTFRGFGFDVVIVPGWKWIFFGVTVWCSPIGVAGEENQSVSVHPWLPPLAHLADFGPDKLPNFVLAKILIGDICQLHPNLTYIKVRRTHLLFRL